MAEVIKKIYYFTMDVNDKPGEGAKILNTLSMSGVNLLAFSGFPSGRRSQLDFVPEDFALFRKVLTRAKIKARPKKEGFLICGKDKPGAVARVVKRLAEVNINMTAMDAVSAGGGRYGAILWVKPKDVKKAAKALKAV